MEHNIARGLSTLGIVLALGMSASAFIFGTQAKKIGSAKQTITVKGLAEKPITATQAQWQIDVSATADTFEAALNRLRQERPALEQYLNTFGFSPDTIQRGTEEVTPNMVHITNAQGNQIEVQQGYKGTQSIVVQSEHLDKIQEARAKIVEYQAQNHPINSGEPEFLVGNLDEVKLALIGEATKNAKARADEFAKYGDVDVGTMRSASQGTFDILPADGQADDTSGGTYNKNSIDKMARVVVTIEYNIDD